MANLKNITDVPVVESAEGLNLIVNDNGAAKQIAASAVGAQADWNIEDVSSLAYIKNKPIISDYTMVFDMKGGIGTLKYISEGTYNAIKSLLLEFIPANLKIAAVDGGHVQYYTDNSLQLNENETIEGWSSNG